MRYIDQWLSGLGLDHVIPLLQEHGITTPNKLAQLSLRDMYEVVGVNDAEDRKKLYFLIQRLQSILKKGPGKDEGDSDTMGSGTSHPHDNKAGTSSDTTRHVDVSPVRCRVSDGQQAAKSEMPESTIDESNLSSVNHIRAPSPIDTPTDSPQRAGVRINASISQEKSHFSNRVSVGGKHGGLPPSLCSQPVGGIARSLTHTQSSPESTSAPLSSMVQSTNSPRKCTQSIPPEPKPISSHLSGSPIFHRAGRESLRASMSPPPSPPPAPPENRKNKQYISSNYASNRNYDPASYAPIHQQDNSNAYYQMQVSDDMAIRVVVRKRPVSRTETGKGDRDVLEIRPGGHVLVHEPKTKVDLTKVVETQEFFFDDAFFDNDTNESIYARAIRPLVNTAFDGGKASCFAYGQTGSGKTFTMMGSNPSNPALARKNAGLYVLAARDIFGMLHRRGSNRADDMKVMVSCFEIYGGKLFDLLNERGTVRCLEDAKQQVQLPGLTEHQVKSVVELLALMGTAHEQRSTGSTGANLESSRSHQVLQLSLQVTASGAKTRRNMTKKVGQLSFIDLAGSERGADTRHNSKQTRMEGAEINTSLLALKEVIRSLEKKQGHTPFRGSKLTQVLKDSFVGDNTKTCMVACVSPNMANCEHTLNTLRYADRVKEHQSQSSQGRNVESNQRPATAAPVSVPPAKDAYTRPMTSVQSSHDAHPDFHRFDLSNSSGALLDSVGSRPSSMGVPVKKREVVSLTRPPPPPDSYDENVPVYSARASTISANRIKQYEGKSSPCPATQHPSEVSASSPSVSGLRFCRGGNNSGDSGVGLIQCSDSGGSSHALKNAKSSKASDFNSSENFKETPPGSESAGNVQPISGEMSEEEFGEGWADDDEYNSEDGLVEDVEDTDEPVIFGYESKSLGGTVLLQRTVDLVSAHKLAIAEMVEVMKEEMELVQDMEQTELRDSHQYVSQLETILAAKKESVNALRKELKDFQAFRFESKA
mmetsp:Transcript_4885/g.7440  ORF Transcript_4885/g.7440 Transcript_4885/m.7440 type:complete len:988 (+) Transcript_4885:188-3151(+)|eukprot:CAMPEP_0185041186 /NCGR_PEP_ID=MMETSP1103-20130426/40119_1 /TAXON_ID=36769 /ORGANISM="Paraphysomonas bandaiensis, Strain Caron Lab Isolate" /LENGTH=987 /DNA_ID=CAMNT_0027580805 /DNA_START=169 /DNA_END=3132 /DNA_ORIENTATION=+